jgi:uncharacterized protein involved in outer membrane biogenesis
LKHPLLIACGLVVVILFTALIAPFLINWTAYRAEIENEAGRILGRQVVINGDIDIRLLPSGVIRFDRVEVKSPNNSNSAAVASIERVKARLALAPLLRGKFQFTDIELVRPTFRFDVSLRGVPNWEIGTDTNFGGLIDPKDIILDDVLISGGSVFFRDARRRVAYDVSGINARVSAGALVGPYSASGELVLAGRKRQFSLRTGRADATNIRRISLRLTVPEKEDEQISFDGFLDTSDQGPRFDGKVVLNQDISEIDFPKSVAPGKKEKFFAKLEAEIATSFVGVRLEDIKAVISQGSIAARFTGRAQALWQDSSEFIIELKSKRLDVDRFLGLAKTLEGLAQKAPEQKAQTDKTRPPVASTAWFLGLMADALPGIWRNGFDGRLSLDIGTVILGGLAIEETVTKLRFADNHIEVMEASGNLPGRSRLSLNGLFLTRDNVARFDGSFNFNALNAKDFARWLIPSLDPLMGSKVSGHSGKIVARGDIRVTPKSIDLLDMVIKLDETQATAGLSYALRKRPAFGLALSIDQIDLDQYFPPDRFKAQSSTSEYAGKQFVTYIANLFMRFDANIRLNAERLISRGIATRGFAADVGLEAGRLTINKLDFADIGGSSLTTKGTIVDINGKPTGVLEASLVAPDPTDLFNLLGIGAKNPDGSQNEEVAKSFGPLNMGVSFEASLKDGQPQRLFKVSGSAGGTKISSRMLLLGELNDVARSKLDFDAEAVNDDGARLLVQLGWVKPGAARVSSQPGVVRARIKGDVDQRLEIGFGLQAYGAQANLTGTLASSAGEPLLESDLTVESEDARPLLAVLRVPVKSEADGALPLSFKGLLSGKISEFVLTNFNGSVGKTPVSLNGTLSVGGRVPLLKATVQTQEISFPWVFNALFGGAKKPTSSQGSSDQVWSAQPFDLSRLKQADMMIDLLADKIVTTTTQIEDARVEIRSQRGKFDLKRFSGSVFGGELNVKATLDEEAGSLKLTSQYTLIDAELEQIARIKENRWAIDGKTYISGTVKARGRSARGLVSSMQGAGVLKIQNGFLNGINPVTFAKALARVETESELNSIIDGILADGKMSYGDLDASFTINSGLVGTTGLRFKSESVTGKTSLVVDLTVFKLDNEWRFSFDDFPNSPPLLLLYTGPINAPDRTFNAEGLREFLVVKTLQEGVKRLEKLEEEERQRLARRKMDVRIKQPDPVKPVLPEKPEVGPPDRFNTIVPPQKVTPQTPAKPQPVN